MPSSSVVFWLFFGRPVAGCCGLTRRIKTQFMITVAAQFSALLRRWSLRIATL